MAKINMRLDKNPMPSQDPDVRNKNFQEVALGYTEEHGAGRGRALPQLQEPALRRRLPGERPHPRVHRQGRRRSDFEGAYQVIHQTTSLPAVCGRVCPQESQCETQVRARHQGRARRHRPSGALRRRLAQRATHAEAASKPACQRPQGRRRRLRPRRPDLRGRSGQEGL